MPALASRVGRLTLPKISEAYVDIGARMGKLKKGLAESQSATKKAMAKIARTVSGAFRSIAGRVMSILSGLLRFGIKWAKRFGLAIAAGMGIAIKFASDAEQAISRFNIVLGDQAKAAMKFAEAVAQNVGRATTDILDAVATFQSFFVGLGFGNQDARKLSETMSRLSLDFASFNNLADEDSMQRFISALSGSGEVLARFGINIKQSALDLQLVALGFEKSTQGATEQQKALARVQIIYRSMQQTNAVGNAAETSEEFANQAKRLRGELKMLAEAIGFELLPGTSSLISKLTDLVAKLRGQVGPFFEWWRGILVRVKEAIDNMLQSLKDFVEFDATKGTQFDKLLQAAEVASVKIKFLFLDMWDTVLSSMSRSLIKQFPLIAGTTAQLQHGADLTTLLTPATGDEIIAATIDKDLAELRKLREQQLAAELLGIKLRAAGRPAPQGQPGGATDRAQLPITTIPKITLPDIITKKIAQSLVSSIQTATGTFKFAQQNRQTRLMEDLVSVAKAGVAATDRVNESVGRLAT